MKKYTAFISHMYCVMINNFQQIFTSIIYKYIEYIPAAAGHRVGTSARAAPIVSLRGKVNI